MNVEHARAGHEALEVMVSAFREVSALSRAWTKALAMGTGAGETKAKETRTAMGRASKRILKTDRRPWICVWVNWELNSSAVSDECAVAFYVSSWRTTSLSQHLGPVVLLEFLLVGCCCATRRWDHCLVCLPMSVYL
jgi:hypothetical protein